MTRGARRRPPLALVASLLTAGVVLGCTSHAGRMELPRSSATAPVDVLVQGAIELEVRPLLDALDGAEEIQLAAWTFWRGRMSGKSVVVSRTEVGPINAAAATTLGILAFRPALVISQGTAGAHDPDLRIFDLVLGRASTDFGGFESTGARLGEGVSMSRWRPLPHALRLDGDPRQFHHFPGDATALRIAAGTPYPHGRLVPAVIGSAFQFNNELDRLDWLRATYGTVSEDMESAFAAGVAHGFGTRFVAIRVIANSGFLTDPPEQIAARRCGEFVVRLIARLP
jgi:adenosylhomocysteine nucleosidase